MVSSAVALDDTTVSHASLDHRSVIFIHAQGNAVRYIYISL